MPTAKKDAKSPIAFMKSLFRGCGQKDGFINLRFISPVGLVKNEWIRITGVEKTLPTMLECHRDYNCFFGVALREKNRGDKRGITKIPALWLDVDLKNIDDEKKKEFGERFKRFPLKPSFVVKSGGGLHLYWKLDSPVSSKEIQKIEELNKRLASYFFADPSACEAARILRMPGTRNLKYEWKPMVEICQEFSDESRAYSLEDLDLRIPLPEVPPSKERNARLEGGWEKAFLEGVEEGKRNSALTRLAGRWFAHSLSNEEVTLLSWAWNEKNKPPLPDWEVLQIIDSIWKKHFNRDDGNGEEDSASSPDYKVATIREIFNYPEPSFLIDQILPEGTVSALGAYTGTGKSLVALSMIKAVLTGNPLFGHYKVKKKGPVLLVDEETPNSFLRERLIKMDFNERLPLSLLHFQGVRLDSPKSFDKLKEKVQQVKPVFIVVDSLIRVHRKKEDDAAEMSRVMEALRKLANLGTTVLVIHHHRKGEGPANQKLRGSSDIPGGIDLEFALVKKDDFLLFSSVKTRIKPLPPIRLKLKAGSDTLEIVYAGALPGKRDQILEAVVSLLDQRKEMSISAIATALKQRAIRIGEKNLRSILSRAESQQVTTKSGPRGKKLYRINPGWQFRKPMKKEKLPRSKRTRNRK